MSFKGNVKKKTKMPSVMAENKEEAVYVTKLPKNSSKTPFML